MSKCRKQSRFYMSGLLVLPLAIGSFICLPELTYAAPNTGAAGTQSLAPSEQMVAAAVRELKAKQLLIPIMGADPEQWKDSFYQMRGDRLHEAVDILAPRDTPIYAIDDGTIHRLTWNAKGGNTIYQKDATGRFQYYYAHLERYYEGINAGDFVRKGQLIGFVGTTGNAPPDCPHLHLSIEQLTSPTSYKGFSINPYEVFSPLPFAPDRKSLARARRVSPGIDGSQNLTTARANYGSDLMSSAPALPPAVQSMSSPSVRQGTSGAPLMAPSQKSVPGVTPPRHIPAQTATGFDFAPAPHNGEAMGLSHGRRLLRYWISRKGKKWQNLGLPVRAYDLLK